VSVCDDEKGEVVMEKNGSNYRTKCGIVNG